MTKLRMIHTTKKRSMECIVSGEKWMYWYRAQRKQAQVTGS